MNLISMEHRILCNSCWMGGQTSKVYPEFPPQIHTSENIFYDEDGRFHVHEKLSASTKYRCSKGHTWTLQVQGQCWCGWKESAVQA